MVGARGGEKSCQAEMLGGLLGKRGRSRVGEAGLQCFILGFGIKNRINADRLGSELEMRVLTWLGYCTFSVLEKRRTL